jgi:predicted DNA-binding transcriptional regulator
MIPRTGQSYSFFYEMKHIMILKKTLKKCCAHNVIVVYLYLLLRASHIRIKSFEEIFKEMLTSNRLSDNI